MHTTFRFACASTVTRHALLREAVAGLWTRCAVCCRLASKTDMLERLYDCLTALQQQYELNREDGLYWQQTAQTTATQLAMTGEASMSYAIQLHGSPAHSVTSENPAWGTPRWRVYSQCNSRLHELIPRAGCTFYPSNQRCWTPDQQVAGPTPL